MLSRPKVGRITLKPYHLIPELAIGKELAPTKRFVTWLSQRIDLIAALFVGLFIAATAFKAFRGNFRGSWGYGEFWINYSAGYVRRGLSGEILLYISKFDFISAYNATVLILTLIIALNLLLFNLLLKAVVKSQAGRLYLQINATLFLFIVHNPSTYIRKDHLIVLGLLLHGLLAVKARRQEIAPTVYTTFVYALMFMFVIVGQIHEIQALFIPLHLYILHSTTTYLGIERKKFRIQAILLLFIMLGTLALSALFHGNEKQVNSIISSIPVGEQVEFGAIRALGWTSGEALNLSARMFSSEATLLCFGLIITIGPVVIGYITGYFIGGENYKWRLIALSPTLILFFVGWDWGRWISLISFSIVSLANCDDQKLGSRRNLLKFQTASTLILIILFSLLWRNPECCNRAPEEALYYPLKILHSLGIRLTP
jgi:hypothetical protein